MLDCQQKPGAASTEKYTSGQRLTAIRRLICQLPGQFLNGEGCPDRIKFAPDATMANLQHATLASPATGKIDGHFKTLTLPWFLLVVVCTLIAISTSAKFSTSQSHVGKDLMP